MRSSPVSKALTVVDRAQKLVDMFNKGQASYVPEGLTASVENVDDDSGDYSIEIRETESEDLVETFADITEFTEWLLALEFEADGGDYYD